MRRVIALLAVFLSCCLLCTACLGQRSLEARLKTEFTSLDKAYTRAEKKSEEKLKEPLQKAKTDQERGKIELDMAQSLVHAYLPRFLNLERRARGTEAGARALIWVVGHQPLMNVNDGKVPLAIMTRDYIQSPLLEQMTAPLAFLVLASKLELKPTEESLLSIAKRSPHRKVRACALYILGRMLTEVQQAHNSLLQLKRQAEDLRKQKTASPENIKEMELYIALAERTVVPEGRALQVLSQVRKDYADTEYAKKADNGIFELEHLAIGKVAPDFEATDQEGEKFKLSDYRGKVVVLDFWGFW